MPKNKKINVYVVCGGKSGEHEVSIVSALSVMKALDKKKYNIIPVGITKTGQWMIGVGVVKALQSGRFNKKLALKNFNNLSGVVFPVLHGTYGEDGKIQGLLEILNLAYVGGEVLGSAIAMDKVVQKQLVQQVGLPVVNYDWFYKADWQKSAAVILRRLTVLKFPLFVKPANLGSSVGISKANNKNELLKAIKLALKFDDKIIVEEGIIKPRELQCGVLGNSDPQASIVGEVVPMGEFYDFAAKYYDDKTAYYFPAKNLSAGIIKQTQSLSIKTFKLLNLYGLARVEFFLDKKNKLYVNEVNTMPGFTSHSIYPKLWQASGLDYSRLLDKLISLALARHQQKNKLTTDFSSGSDWYKNS